MNKRKPLIHQALRNDKLVFVLVRGGLLDGHRGATSCTNKGFVFEDNFETRCCFLWYGNKHWRGCWENVRWHCSQWSLWRLIWVFYFWICSSCSRFVWMERETNATFWSSFSCIFVLFFLFWEERDIKLEQKYLFTLNFNRSGLQISNGGNHRWVKCQNWNNG